MELKKKKRLEEIEKLLKQHEDMFDRIPCAQHTLTANWEKMKPLLEMKSYFGNTIREEHRDKIIEGLNEIAQKNREKDCGVKEQDRTQEEE
jgi:hypothetical protein